jgi:hypothetical protein
MSATDEIRGLSLVAPGFRARVEAVLAEAAGAGHVWRVNESLRTDARQAWLYAQGRTRAGAIVTNAPSATTSMHGHGLAVDLLPSTGWDKTPMSVWLYVGRLAKKHGLVWGGDWDGDGDTTDSHPFDAPHLQMPLPSGAVSPTPGMIAALKNGGPRAVWALVPGALLSF